MVATTPLEKTRVFDILVIIAPAKNGAKRRGSKKCVAHAPAAINVTLCG
jgi:hypothetical protein